MNQRIVLEITVDSSFDYVSSLREQLNTADHLVSEDLLEYLIEDIDTAKVISAETFDTE
jgi:hypothetical protein